MGERRLKTLYQNLSRLQAQLDSFPVHLSQRQQQQADKLEREFLHCAEAILDEWDQRELVKIKKQLTEEGKTNE